MVGVVEIDSIGRILDAVLLLQAVASAQRNSTAAQHGVPADIMVLIEDED